MLKERLELVQQALDESKNMVQVGELLMILYNICVLPKKWALYFVAFGGEKTHRYITLLGFEPPTFAIPEQMPNH